MEYTKDVIFNVNYKDKISTIRLGDKRKASKIFRIIKDNKFIISILSALVILIAMDIVLVNTFFNLIITI